MPIDQAKYSRFLDRLAADLDIPPKKYEVAVARYKAVGKWLEQASYPGAVGTPQIYPQGSFRLGTVTRPIRNGVESSYDIDLVCQLPISKVSTSPKAVKSLVGERLRNHGTYRDLLVDEGRRCWTLEYSEADGIGFHLDVLPAVPDVRGLLDTSIAITNRCEQRYEWSPSNPTGYATWFDGKNAVAFGRVRHAQKQKILNESQATYASIDAVPDQLVRTPLQRSIQIMKRHRDLRFNHDDATQHAPISIVITTLAAHLYRDESDVYSALVGIVRRLQAHTVLIEGRALDPALTGAGLIRRLPDGRWHIENPAKREENFADRWHEDNHARARAFFGWVQKLSEDLVDIPRLASAAELQDALGRSLGPTIVAKHIGLLGLAPLAIESPPRIHITDAPKPWSSD